jgi:hypothetical protein
MDPQVLIQAIQAAKEILGRINSKRLMVFYGFLLFLVYVEANTWKMGLGAIAFLITQYMVWKNPKNSDSLDGK